jgi:hypothetical protein
VIEGLPRYLLVGPALAGVTPQAVVAASPYRRSP